MEAERFDDLTRLLARSPSRRVFLKSLAAAVTGGLLGVQLGGPVSHAQHKFLPGLPGQGFPPEAPGGGPGPGPHNSSLAGQPCACGTFDIRGECVHCSGTLCCDASGLGCLPCAACPGRCASTDAHEQQVCGCGTGVCIDGACHEACDAGVFCRDKGPCQVCYKHLLGLPQCKGCQSGECCSGTACEKIGKCRETRTDGTCATCTELNKVCGTDGTCVADCPPGQCLDGDRCVVLSDSEGGCSGCETCGHTADHPRICLPCQAVRPNSCCYTSSGGTSVCLNAQSSPDANCSILGSDAKCCNGSCVHTDTDITNCGSCGHLCEPGQSCQGGQCTGGSTGFRTCPNGVQGSNGPHFQNCAGGGVDGPCVCATTTDGRNLCVANGGCEGCFSDCSKCPSGTVCIPDVDCQPCGGGVFCGAAC
jgi:hypothetical protein